MPTFAWLGSRGDAGIHAGKATAIDATLLVSCQYIQRSALLPIVLAVSYEFMAVNAEERFREVAMGNVISRTLMCRDHEVLHFAYDPALRTVVGKPNITDPGHLPLGCLDNSGTFSSARLAQWLSSRAIPATRPGLSSVLQRLDLDTPEELMAASLGLSLSDQYWLRPKGFTGAWQSVNYFNNPFSTALGEALAPHDPDSGAESLARLGDDTTTTSAPDSSLNGNLPKRWEFIGGLPHLVKSGKPENLFQEPLNERVATLLCRRILTPGDYVPYELVQNGYPRYLSSCPCMVDENTEFVPAADVIRSMKVRNELSRYEAFAAACETRGLHNAREQLAKMLVVDHIIANSDRHWGNFGVLMDSETREWVRMAPLFDMGEALWCDRALANDFSPYRMKCPMPFARKIETQLERYAQGLSWLEADRLVGFVDEAIGVLEFSRALKDMPGRLSGIATALESTVADVTRLRA